MTLKSLLLNVRKMSAFALISAAPAGRGLGPIGALVVGGLISGALAGCGTLALLAPKGKSESERIQPSEYDRDGLREVGGSFAGVGVPARHTTEITGLFALPSDSGAAALSIDKVGDVLIWDSSLSDPRKVAGLGACDVVTLSQGGDLLAKAHGSSIAIISLPDGREVASLGRIKARPTSIEFDRAGDTLLIGGADARVYRWRFRVPARTEKEIEKSLERYVGPASVVNRVRYHPFGRVFFAGDWDGRIYAFLGYDSDPFGGEYDKNLFGKRFFSDTAVRSRGVSHAGSPIEELLVSSDGEFLSFTTQQGGLEHWMVRGFKRVARVDAHRGLVTAHALSADGREIATAGRDGELKLWTVVEERESEDAPAVFTIERKASSDLFGVHHLVYLADGALAAGQGRRVIKIPTDGNDVR